MKPRFFASPARFRAWLEGHHATARELWVGFHKRDSGKPSITWPESVDQALCFGWIDGIRKSLGPTSYAIRFTPRKPGSIWSTVNLRRARALARQRLMRPAGLEAFEARRIDRARRYSFEQGNVRLPARYVRVLKRNRAAWAFFRTQPPGYRRIVTWYVISAKQETTRRRRLERLIADSARQLRIGLLQRRPAPGG